jgi:hypothetical protein
VPNLTATQMHSQCICNVQIWELICNSRKSIQKFVITFVHNTKVNHKLRICEEYKSEVLVDNKDLHVVQIPNLAK